MDRFLCWQKCVTATWQWYRVSWVLGLCIKGQDVMFWISVDLKKSAVTALAARKQIVFWWCVQFFWTIRQRWTKPHFARRYWTKLSQLLHNSLKQYLLCCLWTCWLYPFHLWKMNQVALGYVPSTAGSGNVTCWLLPTCRKDCKIGG